MITVMGIDQSYTSTGICILDKYHDPDTGDVCTVISHTEIISTEPGTEKGMEDDLERARAIALRIAELIREYRPTEIMMEAPSFSSVGNATRSLSVLFGYLLGVFEENDIQSVPPSTLKKFATGKGNVKKPEMFDAISEPEHLTHIVKYKKSRGRPDIVDAYWLAQYALNRE